MQRGSRAEQKPCLLFGSFYCFAVNPLRGRQEMGGEEFLIVGLGNPETKYELTRHNAGFLALDHFAATHSLELHGARWQGLYCRSRVKGARVILLKPQTYMNRSGECVSRFAHYYKIAPKQILVLHDDLDLARGRIKVTARGGAGGHNGIRSIIRHLGTQDFSRVKIGIGRPEATENGRAISVERYVLSRFSDREQAIVNDQLAIAAEAVLLFISDGIDACMNRINSRKGPG
jgi:PTH1 family peptidyl-tRNA hydrolase